VRPSDQSEDPLSQAVSASRREFLQKALSTTAAIALQQPARVLGQVIPSDTEPTSHLAPTHSARVIRVASKRLISARAVNPTILRESLSKGLCALTREKTVADAWNRLLSQDDVLLLKFNQSGAERIGTTPPMARELVLSLQSAGWSPERIIILEVGVDDPRLIRQTRSPDLRWQGTEIEFGKSGRDTFLAALDQATAIINIPFLKTHHLATMTGCLKNLSHGLIRHPSRFHANGCDPAIAEIVSSRPIQDRLRLNIMNALRVVYEGGPDSRDSDIHGAGELLLSVDPVACDATGYGILNEIRSLHELNPLLPGASAPRFLTSAARLRIGQADTERIKVTTLIV